MKPSSLDLAVSSAQLLPAEAKQRLDQFWRANAKHITSVTAGGDEQRIMRVTYSVLYRNPKLIVCTPFSLLNGIVLSHQMGLVLGTGEVSLVPFGSEATLIIGYQGKVKLALASKLIASVQTGLILEGDHFYYEVTEKGPAFTHRPEFRNRAKATEENTIAAYCQLGVKDGGIQTRIVDLSEILDARGRSRGYKYQISKNGTDNPWITDFGAMALKTAVHRAMKLSPQDARMSLATAVDDEDEGGGGVIADGLNPGEFADADLKQPLLETGADAAQGVARKKLEDAGQNFIPQVTRLPDAVEQVLGHTVSYKGVHHRVVDDGQGHVWKQITPGKEGHA